MSGDSYQQSVRRFLESRGWRVTTTEVQAGVTVLAGVRDGEAGSSRALTMVVEEPQSRVGSEHLTFLLEAGEKKGADRLALTATADVPEAVRNACKQRDIDFIAPDTVRSAAGGQSLGAGVDDISMPEAEQQSGRTRQPPRQSGTDADREGGENRGQPRTQQPRTGSQGAQQPNTGSSSAQQPNAQSGSPPQQPATQSGSQGQQPAAQPGPPSQQPQSQAGGDGTDRRTVLLGGAGVAALAAGGWYVFLRDDGSGGLEGTAQSFVTAVDNGNRERVNDLVAEDGEMGAWSTEDASYAADNSYEMTDFEVVERDGDVAEVDITMRVSDGQVTETTTVRYELHRIDGEWKFWAVLGQPDSNFQQTQAEQTGEESSSQVANNIDITGQVGEINSTGDGISMVRLNVKRTVGSDNLDLTELSIQYVGDNGVGSYGYAGTEATNAFHVVAITAESPNDTVLTDESDRYEILLPFDAPSTDDPTIEDVNGNTTLRVADVTADLGPGVSAELTLTTGDGATRNAMIQVPDTIPDGASTVEL